MAKLDVYLRSIERFGAAGAVLSSGQPVTLRFPTGDRHATQVTPHDQLVGLVREVAPPAVLDQIDKNRPARFDHESMGIRYAIAVAPRPGNWQVTIAAADGTPVPTAAAEAPAARIAPPAPPIAASTAARPDMVIERGQYDGPAIPVVATTSGSTLLDELTRAARAARATDVFLAAGAQPLQRIGVESAAVGTAIDGEILSRELGLVAPADARAAWSEQGGGVFAYSDGAGRVRATLARDQRGPCVALRLLPDEPMPLDRLGLDLGDWLGRGGLVVIAGPAGSGKTIALAAIVRALGERRRRVVAIEDPIEIVQASPWVSQRAVGPHVASVAAGVTSACAEGVDAIAIGAVASADAAAAVIEAAAGGHFVVTTVTTPERPGDRLVIDRIVDWLAADRRELARVLLGSALLGMVMPTVGPRGRGFEVASR